MSDIGLTGDYDLEVGRVLEEIDRANAKQVLLQLPDGLKPHADRLLAHLRKERPTTRFVLWSGSCYGACDAPIHVRSLGFDLLIQFGHAPWRT